MKLLNEYATECNWPTLYKALCILGLTVLITLTLTNN